MLLVYFVRRLIPARPGAEDSFGWLRTILTHISFIDLWGNVMQGRMASRDLVIYLSATIFWLFLTVKVLESRKWR